MSKRLLAGCIPVSADRKQCLLITSRKQSRKLVFPKGAIKPCEDAKAAALREAWEEAGVRCVPFVAIPIGETCKADIDELSAEQLEVCQWLVMKVTEVCEEWPEKKERSRLWVL